MLSRVISSIGKIRNVRILESKRFIQLNLNLCGQRVTTNTSLSRDREYRQPRSEGSFEELTQESLRNVNFEKTKTPSNVALAYFDDLYSNRFGKSEWASIRCSLLSPTKRASFVTRQNDNLEESMQRISAFDIFENFRNRAEVKFDEKIQILDEMKIELFGASDPDYVDIEDLSNDEVLDKQKLSDYQRLDLAIEQLLLSSAMTEGFSCYMTPYGDFSRLPRADEIDEKLDLIEVCPSDIFASLCHSPTQYSNILHYYSNFGSKIHQILSATYPGNYYQINTDPYTHAGDHQILDDQISLNTTKKIIYSNESEIHTNKNIQFDSVLIDAPSLDDRFSVNINSRKNIFHPQNLELRHGLFEDAADVLKDGIRSCYPGGSLTFCSSTMSHLQNEYLIQSVAKSLLDDELFVSSVPLALVVECLPELFFYHDSRLGQLVLPSSGQNFGPRYVCKLQIKG